MSPEGRASCQGVAHATSRLISAALPRHWWGSGNLDRCHCTYFDPPRVQFPASAVSFCFLSVLATLRADYRDRQAYPRTRRSNPSLSSVLLTRQIWANYHHGPFSKVMRVRYWAESGEHLAYGV